MFGLCIYEQQGYFLFVRLYNGITNLLACVCVSVYVHILCACVGNE